MLLFLSVSLLVVLCTTVICHDRLGTRTYKESLPYNITRFLLLAGSQETDDASSRYMMLSNYLLYGKVIINSAMLHGNWNYNVGNVHAYPQQIGTGWGGGGAQTFVYNGTILMRDPDDQWCNELLTQVVNNTIYTPSARDQGVAAAAAEALVAGGEGEVATGGGGEPASKCCAPACPAVPCPPGPPSKYRCSGGGNTQHEGLLPDAEVTRRAQAVLAPFPRAAVPEALYDVHA